MHIQDKVIFSVDSPRPFGKQTYSLFKNWREIPSICVQSIKRAQAHFNRLTNSLLGRVILYAVADTTGALAGKAIGQPLIGRVASTLGMYLGPKLLMTGSMGIGAIVIYSSEVTRTSKIFAAVMTLSLAVCATQFTAEIENWGGDIGYQVGETAGDIAGTILGGYLGLVLVKSPTIFFNTKYPWNSYSTSMLRFLTIGKIFDTIIVKPSTPFIAPILYVPRQLIRSSLQMSAYNSHLVLSAISHHVRKTPFPQKTPFRFFTQVFLNSYCGHNGALFSNQLSFSISPFFESLSPSVTALLQRFTTIKPQRVLCGSIISNLEILTKKAESLPLVLMNSLRDYLALLSSPKIQSAHKEFECSYFVQSNANEQTNNYHLLTHLIKNKISENSTLFLIVYCIFNQFLKEEDLQQLITTCTSKIAKIEISLIGYPLLSTNRTTYLNALLRVHLPFYLIFTLINFKKLSNSVTTVQEEKDFLLTLNHLIFQHYIQQVTPSILARPAYTGVNLMIKGAFQTQQFLSHCFQQPEQSACLNHSEKLEIKENHLYRPSVPDLSLVPEDDYLLVEQEEA